MSAAFPGSSEIEPFEQPQTPRCKKPYASLGYGMAAIPMTQPCCLYDGHMGKCRPHIEVPPLQRDPTVPPHNPNRR